jgi:hypothetical protein
MNNKTMVAGLAIGSLLIGAGIQATQSVRAESGAAPTSHASGMSGWQEDCHTTMASMMWMLHQHHAMMGAGPEGMMGADETMMGAGPEGMMGADEGMMGAGPEGMMGDGPEGMTAPPSTGPSAETLAPDASLGAGHDQHHPAPSPLVSPEPS